MLTQDFHDAAVGRLMFVRWRCFSHPHSISNLKQSIQPVRRSLIWSNDAEVTFVHVELHDVAQKTAQDSGCLRLNHSRRGNCDRVFTILGKLQTFQ